MPGEPTHIVELEITDGKLGEVLVNGVAPHPVDEKTKNDIFDSPNGPKYLGMVLYATDPLTNTCCIWVHKWCVMLCKPVPCPTLAPNIVKLEITNGILTGVLVDGTRIDSEVVDPETRLRVFGSQYSPRYVSNIMYAVHPVTNECCIWVHKRCVLLCKPC